jgi:hypothetical protein
LEEELKIKRRKKKYRTGPLKIKKRKKKFRTKQIEIKRTLLSPYKSLYDGVEYEKYKDTVGRKECKTPLCNGRVYTNGDYCYYCQKVEDGLITRGDWGNLL